jgi:hypothetical protein
MHPSRSISVASDEEERLEIAAITAEAALEDKGNS